MISLLLRTRHPITQCWLDLTAQGGEITLICGASGRGKSTLLGQVWGSRPLPPGGRLMLKSDGQSHDLAALSPAALAHARPKLMVHVGQNPMILKREHLSAWFRPNDPRLERAMAALDLPAALLDRVAGEVSGGERQRFLLLRAILADCPILLLDEPFTGLDAARTEAVAELLTQTAQDGRMVILSAHQTHGFARKVWNL